MDPDSLLLGVVVATALLFAWSNGVHDASNAVAAPLATRALTPRVALGLAAVLNVVGALLGDGIARLIGSGLLSVPVDGPGLGLGVVLAGLVAAIAWNLLTWWAGVPSSSSHALIGGLAGAGLAASVQVDGGVLLWKVAVPLVASPLVGAVAAWALTTAVVASLHGAPHARTARRFRLAQSVSSSAMALGHGLQDGQKTVGVILLAQAAAGSATAGAGAPMWVRAATALALGLGTYQGGARLIRTLGRRLVPVGPVSGFCAESVAATVLYATTYLFSVPISSTHTVTASIAGAGATAGGWRALRWRVVRPIVFAWVVTLPVTAGIAALCYGFARGIGALASALG